MLLTNILLAVLIVEVWVLAKIIDHTLLLLGEEIEKVTGFLIDIRNAVVKERPGDRPRNTQQH
jgi:hypothetical protein